MIKDLGWPMYYNEPPGSVFIVEDELNLRLISYELHVMPIEII